MWNGVSLKCDKNVSSPDKTSNILMEGTSIFSIFLNIFYIPEGDYNSDNLR